MNLLENALRMTLKEKLFFGLILVIFAFNMAVPRVILAQNPVSTTDLNLVYQGVEPVDLLTQRFIEYKDKAVNIVKPYEVKREMTVIATAYSSTVDQCDDTPCITANGFNVCEHGLEDTIAANFLKFGTKVRIPEVSGDKIYIVRDRMNPRYDHRIDLWMTARNKAITFGKRLVKIEIVE
jgi:3D (Asp-Asp-Asp) domain-containing protein